jgi:hypothetical protein
MRERDRLDVEDQALDRRRCEREIGSTACDLQIGDREISRPTRGGGVVRGEAGSGWLGVVGGGSGWLGEQRVREQR